MLSVSLPTAMLFGSGRTYIVPLAAGRTFPRIPAAGFGSEAEIASLPGARSIDAFDTAVGPSAQVYAFSRDMVERNLFRIPLPK